MHRIQIGDPNAGWTTLHLTVPPSAKLPSLAPRSPVSGLLECFRPLALGQLPVRFFLIPTAASCRGKDDVDQPSESRSRPVDASDLPSSTPSRTVFPTISSSASSFVFIPPPDELIAGASASVVNIESSTIQLLPVSLEVPPQILGRRRRLSQHRPQDEGYSPPIADSLSTVAAISTTTGHRSKRQRRDDADMLSDGDAAGSSNGAGAVHSHGSSTSASQRAAGTLLGSINGSHKSGITNGSSNGEKRTSDARSSLYLGHNREEVTRILIQALTDMGYQKAADNVSQESGFDLESPTVSAFRTAVLSGDWAGAEELLSGATILEGPITGGNGLVLAPGVDQNVMRFWLRQQKFLEQLEQRDTSRALVTLRGELTPLYQETTKLHFLSSLLMCRSTDDLMIKADWDGAKGQSRKKLLSELSSLFPHVC